MRSVAHMLSCGAFVGASACVATEGPAVSVRESVRVTNNGQPFLMSDGALARQVADASCGGKVKTSIYDRFDAATGAWVYPGGCA